MLIQLRIMHPMSTTRYSSSTYVRTTFRICITSPVPGHYRSRAVSHRAHTLALVKEATLGDARLVLRGHLDVRRGEQEDLVSHLIDGPAQAEDQSRREVDEPTCVAVDHLGQVHDHRGAFAKVLTDGPGFIVSARVECRDPGELNLPWRNGLDRLLGHLTAVIGADLRGFHRPGLLVFLVVLAIVVVTILIPALVLHEAKVDRHLAHRAGHPSVLRRAHSNASPRTEQPSTALRVGHYGTVVVLSPSNAVPILRCVAPHSTAASRSPLMPAEPTVADGLTDWMPADSPRSGANAARGSSPSGAPAISPPRASPGSASIASAISSIRSAGTPPRFWSPSRLTWTRQMRAAPATFRPGVLRAAAPRCRTRRIRSTECTMLAYSATLCALLLCNCPTKCHVTGCPAAATAAALGAASWSRFSPQSVSPRLASASPAAAGYVLVTATSVISSGSRPAAAHAAAIRFLVAARLRESSAARLT